MQVCTLANGKTVVMASGKPLSPSTTAIRMSSTPRLRNSFMTFNQNLAPSFCSIQMPSTSLLPSVAMPSARYTALFLTLPSSQIFTQRVEIDHRIAALQRPILPLHHRFQHRIGHRADEVRAHLHPVVIKQKTLNLPYRHPPRIHRDNLFIEAFEALLPFGNQ